MAAITFKGLELFVGYDDRTEDAEWRAKPEPGTYYLVLRSPTMPGKGRDTYHLLAEPELTNQSREPKTRGRLGTTNDVALYAEGRVQVYTSKAGHLRLRRLED